MTVKAIPRALVESKLLKSVGYDPETKTLHAEFHSGAVYAYHDVPQELADATLNAKSVGGHFLAHIRHGGFSHTRLDD